MLGPDGRNGLGRRSAIPGQRILDVTSRNGGHVGPNLGVVVIPEYTGALGFFYDDAFSETDPDAVYDAVLELLPEEFTMLARSEAEDNDSLTVTAETAQEHGLTTIADLAEVAGEMTLGAVD